MHSLRKYSPVLIIGAGLAGCVTALCLADKGIGVTLLSAGESVKSANSWLAQGGIIYQASAQNDAESLIEDILTAGHHHNHHEMVRFLATQGPKEVENILVQRLGVPFDKLSGNTEEPRLSQGEWDLTREGGHSAQRILHCADHTGSSIMQYLLKAVYDSPNISFLSGYTAIDLLTSHHHTRGMTYRYQLENQCCGAYILHEASGAVETCLADITVLATGGVGQVFLHTTNSAVATGAGIAMASRAFVRLENMEYVQFHPTTLYHRDTRRDLITEALRGEGAVLVNARGQRFMLGRDQRAELAPRDIVARGIVDELLSTGEPCVFLDAREVKRLEERFPTVYASCQERGLDIGTQPIPVVPAAHYFCGGILASQQGRTTLERLYAIGECSCTGVHGANRLASTSLLEALLWGKSAGDDIITRYEAGLRANTALHDSIVDWESLGDEKNDDPALIAQDWATIRNTMWNYVGIARTEVRLARAYEDLRDLSRHLYAFYRSTPISKPLIDLLHGCETACLITQAALRNKESKGCHYRT